MRRSLFSELGHFFLKYRMWWLVPVVMIVIAIGLVVLAGGSQSAFLIYALF